jgi:hypothetical protein
VLDLVEEGRPAGLDVEQEDGAVPSGRLEMTPNDALVDPGPVEPVGPGPAVDHSGDEFENGEWAAPGGILAGEGGDVGAPLVEVADPEAAQGRRPRITREPHEAAIREDRRAAAGQRQCGGRWGYGWGRRRRQGCGSERRGRCGLARTDRQNRHGEFAPRRRAGGTRRLLA